MILLDDILLFPAKFPAYICKTIYRAGEEELFDEEKVKSELQDLYMELETGEISDEEFESEEKVLLKKLEAIEEFKKANYGS